MHKSGISKAGMLKASLYILSARERSKKSAMVIEAIALITGHTRRTMQVSCSPFISNGTFIPFSVWAFCGRAMDGTGLIAAVK